MNASKTKVFYTEASYLIGIVILALGTAFMERTGFGMSMVVAPAYLIHLKVAEFLPWFTFGMAEYTFQALLLIVMGLATRRFRMMYLFSFITAVFYGLVLDVMMLLVGLLPDIGMSGDIALYGIGMILGSYGVAQLFHTYIAPEAYELFVKELAGKLKKEIYKVKWVYDLCSCAFAIALSFIFFGLWHFEGVKFGTVVCTIFNGWLIGVINRHLDATYSFKDALKFRKYFE